MLYIQIESSAGKLSKPRSSFAVLQCSVSVASDGFGLFPVQRVKAGSRFSRAAQRQRCFWFKMTPFCLAVLMKCDLALCPVQTRRRRRGKRTQRTSTRRGRCTVCFTWNGLNRALVMAALSSLQRDTLILQNQGLAKKRKRKIGPKISLTVKNNIQKKLNKHGIN